MGILRNILRKRKTARQKAEDIKHKMGVDSKKARIWNKYFSGETIRLKNLGKKKKRVAEH